MNYTKLVQDAWRTTWEHRWLWVLGLFAGGAVGGFSFGGGGNGAQWRMNDAPGRTADMPRMSEPAPRQGMPKTAPDVRPVAADALRASTMPAAAQMPHPAQAKPAAPAARDRNAIDPGLPPDFPLEPGSGTPRPSSPDLRVGGHAPLADWSLTARNPHCGQRQMGVLPCGAVH